MKKKLIAVVTGAMMLAFCGCQSTACCKNGGVCSEQKESCQPGMVSSKDIARTWENIAGKDGTWPAAEEAGK